MTRHRRIFVPGFPFHVVQRGNNRHPIFLDDADRVRYLDILIAATKHNESAIHCYVLMGNHVHLLITPEREGALAKTMQSVGIRYVRYFNTRYERTGGLWDSRYHASLVETDRYLLACYRYIELNPVRAGVVEHPAEYIWSSHRYHAFGDRNRFISTHACYLDLGDVTLQRQERYRALFDQQLTDDEINTIRDGKMVEVVSDTD